MRILPGWVIILLVLGCQQQHSEIYLGTGLKIGELTDTSAIIWVRLTSEKCDSILGIPFPEIEPDRESTGNFIHSQPQLPDSLSLNKMEGSCSGTAGSVRLAYWQESDPDNQSQTGWIEVGSETDYSHQFKPNELEPATEYVFSIMTRSLEGNSGDSFKGSFTTVPNPTKPAPVKFTVVTGQNYYNRDSAHGHIIYQTMLNVDPDFLVHTGDIIYYDKLRPIATDTSLARLHWQRMYSLPLQKNFHKKIPAYFIKDDHDTWQNDCWPEMENNLMGSFTFNQGLRLFKEQVPMSQKTYRTFRWGKDLQIWLMEGRDYRSPNTREDGPEKTIWGEEQIEWIKNTMESSNATFKLLISPTPIVGPDRTNKRDNHSNAEFRYEGEWVRQYLRDQNAIVVCGDRHWQYVSKDKETGLTEYSCGPASDQHAGGFSLQHRTDEHRYLNIIGGFLSVEVKQEESKPAIIFRHHNVKGDIQNEEIHYSP